MASRPGAQGRQARAPEAARQHLRPQPARSVTFSDELAVELEPEWPSAGMACPRTWTSDGRYQAPDYCGTYRLGRPPVAVMTSAACCNWATLVLENPVVGRQHIGGLPEGRCISVARVLKTSAACPSIAAVRAPGPAGVLVRTSTTWRSCATVSALSVPVSSSWSAICWSRSAGGVMTPSRSSMSVSSSTGRVRPRPGCYCPHRSKNQFDTGGGRR
jgi:hypothetical protein